MHYEMFVNLYSKCFLEILPLLFQRKFLPIMYLTYIAENLFLSNICYIATYTCMQCSQTPTCKDNDQNFLSQVRKLDSSHDFFTRLLFRNKVQLP